MQFNSENGYARSKRANQKRSLNIFFLYIIYYPWDLQKMLLMEDDIARENSRESDPENKNSE